MSTEKAKLVFDLTDHDAKQHHLRCVKSTDMALALFDIYHNLRKRVVNVIENRPEELSKDDVIDFIFGGIYDVLHEYDINIDELID